MGTRPDSFREANQRRGIVDIFSREVRRSRFKSWPLTNFEGIEMKLPLVKRRHLEKLEKAFGAPALIICIRRVDESRERVHKLIFLGAPNIIVRQAQDTLRMWECWLIDALSREAEYDTSLRKD